MKRRTFAKITGLGTLAAIAAPSKAFTAPSPAIMSSNYPRENGSAKVPIGVCNYALRGLKPGAGELIDFAIRENLDSILMNNFRPLESLDNSYLSELKKRASLHNISFHVGAGNIGERSPRFSDAYGSAESLLKEGIRIASALGSPVVGCRIGNIEDRYIDGGIQRHIEDVVQVMRSVRTRAQDAGIKFAFENHSGDLRTDELLLLIEETGTDICGAFFDPGNAVTALEDPMEAIKVLGSSIISTSIRDVRIWRSEEGARFQWVAVGDGMMDYPKFVETMGSLCPGVPLHVETISNTERIIPYLSTEFWDGFPDLKASHMIPFLKLVNRGEPMELKIPPPGMTKKDFDIQHQKEELTKSLQYLRTACKAGLKEMN